MNRYWENQSGCYNPMPKRVIDNESKRNKEIHDTINQIKNMLKEKDLVLIERIAIKDKRTKKIYR